MSGSAGLAAAKRRRAGPSAVTNELPKRPSNVPPQSNYPQAPQPQIQQSNISNTHPLIILAQHEQLLNRLQIDIEDLRNGKQVSQPSSQLDEQSIKFFKSKYETMLQELDEMNKRIIKIQTFSMEANLELLKLKKALKVDFHLKDDDSGSTSLNNLSLNDS
jgi:hypothetical protein